MHSILCPHWAYKFGSISKYNLCVIKCAVKYKMTRNAGPSIAQTEKLIGLMETRSDLATGHARTANARARMQKGWSQIARILNSDGNGCIKDWKQWAKYWKDKKAAVKRKANMAEAARQRTGGGIDAEVVELSELELRILTVAGGLSFATGDRHLAINPFPEQENPMTQHDGSEPNSGQSESILLQRNPGPSEAEATQWNETTVAVVGEGSIPEVLEPSPVSPVQIPGVEVHVHPTQDEDETVSLSEVRREFAEGESPVSVVRSRGGGGARRRILVATPRQRRRPSLPGSGQRSRGALASPRAGAAGSAARQRLLRRSPPSQRRSEMASLTERFIAIEERRADAELAIARSQETFAHSQRIIAEAIDKFTNTVSTLAHQVIEAMQHPRAPMN